MAVGNVILSIGSKLGPGGFASLESMIRLVKDLGARIGESVTAADKLNTMLKRTNVEMAVFVDEVSKGHIGIETIVRQMNMLNESAPLLKVTQEQMATMAKRAVDLAQATGRDAVEAFEQMTNGIARAESEALKPFGIKLTESKQMIETQIQAVRALTEGFENMNVEIANNSERMDMLAGNWDLFGKTFYSILGEIPYMDTVLDKMNDTLTETNNIMLTLTETSKDYIFSLEGIADGLKIATMGLVDMIAGTRAAVNYVQEMQNKVAERRRAAAEGDRLFGEMEAEYGAGGQQTMMSDAGLPKIVGGPKKAGGKKSGIKVGKGTIKTDMELAQITGGVHTEPGYSGEVVTSIDEYRLRLAAAQATEAVEIRIEELHREQKLALAEGNVERNARLALVYDEKYQAAELEEMMLDEYVRLQEDSIAREHRIELLQSEFFQHQLLQEMREEEEVARAEQEILLMYQREEAIDFAERFKDAWLNAYGEMSAGAMAAQGTFDLMKQSWGAVVTSAIEGANSIGEGVRRAVKVVGTGIAIEAGWRALLEAAMAIAAGARRQYVKMTKHIAAAGLFTGVAVAAGAAAGVASRVGAASGAGGQPRVVDPRPSATPESGGGYVGGSSRPRDLNINITVDENANLHAAVMSAEDRARINGTETIRGAA